MKNVSQLFSIAAAAPVNVDDGLAAGELGAAAADVAGAADVAAAVGEVATELLELLEPVEQADMVAATARPSTGTSRCRRAMWLIRILASLDGCRSGSCLTATVNGILSVREDSFREHFV